MPPESRISSRLLAPCFDGRNGTRLPAARLLSRRVERLDPHVRPADVGRVRAPSPRRAAECLYAEPLKGAAAYLRTDARSRVRLPVRAWLGPATAAVAGSSPSRDARALPRMARAAALQLGGAAVIAYAGFVVIKPVRLLAAALVSGRDLGVASERVNPALEAAPLADHQFGIAKRVREERDPLV